MNPLRTLPLALLLGLLAALPAAAQADRTTEAPFDDPELFVLVDGPVDFTPTAEEMNAFRMGTTVPEAAASAVGAVEEPLSAYPNPSAGRTTVRFTLDEAAPVRLAVYDLLGREVASLADGRYPAGTHEARFDGSGLAAGLYIVRLDAGGAVETRRLTLAR